MLKLFISTLFFIAFIANANAGNLNNCNLVKPPADAGETQAHGVILYIHPRSHTIDKNYSGCQSQWFLDDDHYRKLSVVHYQKGVAVRYENMRINGGIGYQCHYKDKRVKTESDKRCPAFEKLRRQTYQAGCYSKSKLNWSDSYDVAFDDCKLK